MGLLMTMEETAMVVVAGWGSWKQLLKQCGLQNKICPLNQLTWGDWISIHGIHVNNGVLQHQKGYLWLNTPCPSGLPRIKWIFKSFRQGISLRSRWSQWGPELLWNNSWILLEDEWDNSRWEDPQLHSTDTDGYLLVTVAGWAMGLGRECGKVVWTGLQMNQILLVSELWFPCYIVGLVFRYVTNRQTTGMQVTDVYLTKQADGWQ